MSRINCHSAFKHYEMFHGNKACCGGNSYGSVFNTTYNINCGGHGGFWGGFGYGLGNAFAGLFAGNTSFGGFGNFGNFGFGGGMGGFGFPSFGNFGNLGNIWGNKRTSDDSNRQVKETKETKETAPTIIEKKNADYAKLNALHTRKNDLTKTEGKVPTVAELTKLKEDIEALEADGALDGIEDDKDKKYIEELKKGLDKEIEAAQAREKAAVKAQEEVTDKGVTPIQETPLEEKPVVVDNDATDINTLLDSLNGDYDKLSPEDKAKFDANFKDLLDKMSAEDRVALLKNPKLPAALRAKVKASFYDNGYTNYDGSTVLKDGDVAKAHDKSGKTRDTVTVNGKKSTVTKSDNGNHPAKIVIHDTRDITYTYTKTVDGEYLYTSSKTGNQEYVLQKTGNGYELVQYQYHTGYGKKDWAV